MTILLLENNDIVANSILGGNIDGDRYDHCIRDAQKLYLKPNIGNDLYLKIQADYQANTLTGIYSELFEYIFDYLLHCAVELYLAEGAYQVSDAGITKQSTEFSTTIDKTEVDYLVSHHRVMAESYRKELLKFLNMNSSSIPEYKTYACEVSKGRNIAGIYLPQKRWENPYNYGGRKRY